MTSKKTEKSRVGKLLLIVLMITACMAFAGCAEDEHAEAPAEPIRIAVLNGPTGIGMTYLMENPEKFQMTIYQSPDEIVSKIITGEVDLAAIPSNMASVIYNKTKGQIQVLATNTLGILSIVENGNEIKSVSDLKGRTLLASGQGGVPEYALKYVLRENGIDPENDVEIRWLGNHTDVMTAMLAEENAAAMLPEPFATVAEGKSETVKRVIDMNEAWTAAAGAELPMGVLIAQKSFIEKSEADLDNFMKMYEDSVILVNEDPAAAAELIVKYGFISDEAVAEKAVPKCNIVMVDGKENAELLKGFYDVLFSMDPKALGGKLPDENFFYKNK